MSKQAFLTELKNGLKGMPQEDVEERLTFYGEMIDDRIEEGLSEEDAIASLGSVDEVVNEIVSETPLTKLVKEKIKPKRSLRAWEIVLLVLGFPVWFPLTVVAAVLVLVFYLLIWVLVICLWASELSLWACALAGIAGCAICIAKGNYLFGILLLGAGLVTAGLSIFLFFGCKAATVGTAKLAKKIVHGIKRMFVGKEKTK